MPVGTLAKDYYKVENDTVFEVDITPNRIDAASHYGVARDLAAAIALTQNVELKRPSVDDFKVDDHSFEVKVTVESQQACPRYCGVTVNNVTIKESPELLQDRLRSIGLSAINKIVDVTNYILCALGQPLHALDAIKLNSKR